MTSTNYFGIAAVDAWGSDAMPALPALLPSKISPLPGRASSVSFESYACVDELSVLLLGTGLLMIGISIEVFAVAGDCKE